MADLFNVQKKVVLVTGGAKGIGKMVSYRLRLRIRFRASSPLLFRAQISTGFVQAGAKVYISSRDAASCDKAAEELTKLGPGTCHSIPAVRLLGGKVAQSWKLTSPALFNRTCPSTRESKNW